jgi:hypothetical protein
MLFVVYHCFISLLASITHVEKLILIIYLFIFHVQVQPKSYLRSHFLSQWQELLGRVEWCAHKLRAYGYTCTSLKILFLTAIKFSKDLSTMLGLLSPLTLGTIHILTLGLSQCLIPDMHFESANLLKCSVSNCTTVNYSMVGLACCAYSSSIDNTYYSEFWYLNNIFQLIFLIFPAALLGSCCVRLRGLQSISSVLCLT